MWGTISLLTSRESSKLLEFSKGDETSHSSFDTWARSQISNICVSFKVLERELRNVSKIDQMEKDMADVKAENAPVSNKLKLLEN